MSAELRDVVVRALDALRIGYRPLVGGSLEVTLPEVYRAQFRQRRTVRVVFDPEVWQHDRDAELVTVGSPFLGALEDALRSSGTVSVVVGGEWRSRPEWLREWRDTTTVLNGTFREASDRVVLETAIRITYEVAVQDSIEPPELVPIVWHEGKGVLDPAAVAGLARRTWYTPDEVDGIGGEPPDPRLLARARKACEQELARRVPPLFAGQLARRNDEIAREEQRARREADQRLLAAKTAAERQRIHEELEERRIRFERARKATWTATERTIRVWRLARVDTRLRFERADGRAVEVPLLRASGDRLRADLCAACTEIRHRYLLAPGREPTALLCEACAAPCADPDCAELVLLRERSRCSLCASPRYCVEHVIPCAACGRDACDEHGVTTDCCRAWICDTDVPPLARDGRRLCPTHGQPCAVDRVWTPVEELVECPITKRRLWRGNAVAPPDDGRLLHPEAVVVCASDGAPLARDRAGACAVDLKWYRLADLVTCSITGTVLYRGNAVRPAGDDRLLHPSAVVTCASTRAPVAKDRARPCAVDGAWHRREAVRQVDGEWLCPQHVVVVDVPPGRALRSDRVVVCAGTGQRLAPEAAGTCSVRKKTYERSLLVRCPLSQHVLHRDEAIRPPDDGRALHPSVVVRCSATGAWVARDRAVRDELAPREAWLAPSAAARCAYSGKWTAASQTVQVACCDRTVAIPYASQSPISGRWACRSHRRRCTRHEAFVLPSEAVRCEVLLVDLCVEHTVHARCGCRVAPEKTLPLSEGGHGCVRHYVTCAGAEHGILKDRASSCHVCGQPVCRDHTAPDRYDPPTHQCARHVRDCSRCGFAATHRDGRTCVWCERRQKIGSHPEALRVYRDEIQPALSWATRLLPVEVIWSGTGRAMVFEVSTLLGVTLYRRADGILEVKEGTRWRVLL